MASNTVIYSNVLAGVLFSALTPVFIQLSKTDGKIKYHPMEVSILVEMVKCAFSLASLQYARWQRGYEPEYGDNGVVLDQFDWKGSLPYLFPAFFYQVRTAASVARAALLAPPGLQYESWRTSLPHIDARCLASPPSTPESSLVAARTVLHVSHACNSILPIFITITGALTYSS